MQCTRNVTAFEFAVMDPELKFCLACIYSTAEELSERKGPRPSMLVLEVHCSGKGHTNVIKLPLNCCFRIINSDKGNNEHHHIIDRCSTHTHTHSDIVYFIHLSCL